MPLQHSLQKYVREVGKIGTSEAAQWDDAKREEIKGAKKVLDKLAAEGIAESLTTWKDVQESELVEKFRKNPGTIWGFEEMRRPFVQAAHEKDEGARPVRMMELWDATLGLLSGGGYKGLTESPEKEVKDTPADAGGIIWRNKESR